MAAVELKARYQVKDEEGNAVMNDGQAVWEEVTCSYDLGETLDEAIDKFGTDVVFSQFVANAKVKLQGIMRDKKKAGLTDDAIQAFLDTYKLGEVMERVQVNPMDAVKAAFATWSPEKQKEYLRELGVVVD